MKDARPFLYFNAGGFLLCLVSILVLSGSDKLASQRRAIEIGFFMASVISSMVLFIINGVWASFGVEKE